VAGLAAGAAIAVSLVLGDAPEDHAVELVPADVALYATVHLDPSLGQKRATKDVLDRARDAGAGDGSSESLEDVIGALVTGSTPADYKSDIKPYVGDQIALYQRAGDDEATLLMATEDPQASQRAMHRALKREYPDVYYRIVNGSYRQQPYEHVVYRDFEGAPPGAAFTVVDGFVVIGDEEGVRASIDASSGASLATSEKFEQARGKLSDDVLGFAYFDGKPLEEAARTDPYATSDELVPLELLADVGPVAATLTARDSRLELDLAAGGASGRAGLLQNPSALLAALPAEAIGAISLGDFGAPLRETLGRSNARAGEIREAVFDLAELDADSDVASWLGQLGAYVAGEDTDTVEGGLVAETRSPRSSDQALDQIESYYSSSYDYGFDDYVYGSDDGLGFDVVGTNVVQVRGDEDRVVAGMGAAGFSTYRALDADGGFGESEVYRRAAGMLGGYEPFLVIDAPPMQRLLEEATDAYYDETYVNEVQEWLSTISTVAGGVRRSGDDIHVKLVAEVGG
jgi:hypothetical protein